ncbi:MAG: methyltransferase domain-containing protein [bacterium]|nr:methyltransferase domain-containing protein [bacterium]
MEKNPKKNLFPLSSKYDTEWIKKNSMGENVLFNLESLCEVMNFNSGMRVLDLGCGKAASAIFLAKEFGVKVYAIDPKVDPGDNLKRITEMGCECLVTPLRLDARMLPFPPEYFDAIIAVDSFMYFGTDMVYTEYITNFLKPKGQIGIVDICVNKEIECISCIEDIPASSGGNFNFLQELGWWYRHWHNSNLLKIDKAEIVPHNDFIKDEYIKDVEQSNKKDIIAEELKRDSQKHINVFRMVAEKYETVFHQNFNLSRNIIF